MTKVSITPLSFCFLVFRIEILKKLGFLRLGKVYGTACWERPRLIWAKLTQDSLARCALHLNVCLLLVWLEIKTG